MDQPDVGKGRNRTMAVYLCVSLGKRRAGHQTVRCPANGSTGYGRGIMMDSGTVQSKEEFGRWTGGAVERKSQTNQQVEAGSNTLIDSRADQSKAGLAMTRR
ncbi:hypothetical protein chiPu_0027839 [Chiloscyllium punctatum]|uniref:Uncharacterized protein n=1 Tax=Chiloscyllium punctatum TaxID=137246 RepID=A0A401TM22_CHIPU|nr:hypothetical protein [Chiloscyllium punctatum]